MGNKVLDVREIDKKFRKKMILNLFDNLPDNNQLELISDHSLAPLNRLFHIEKNGFFEWKDLESGPEIWRISLRKIKSLNLTINQILKQFPFAIDVFESHGISYYKNGTSKLSDLTANARAIFEEIKSTKGFAVKLIDQ